MAISGTYYVKMWLPNPEEVHGNDPKTAPPAGASGGMPEGGFPPGGPGGAPAQEKPQVELKDYGPPRHGAFEGDLTFHFTPNPDGSLSGDAEGQPIYSGFYTGDEFFKVDFPAGPGRFEIWARVDEEGYLEGMISVGEGRGWPNFVYGRKID